jgi:hypothetical protein
MEVDSMMNLGLENIGLWSHLMGILKSGDMSDVDINVCNVDTGKIEAKYRLHKLILSRCKYFVNLLCGSWKEKNTVEFHSFKQGWIEKKALDLFFEMLYREYFEDIKDSLIEECLAVHCLSNMTGFNPGIDFMENLIIEIMYLDNIREIISYCNFYDVSPKVKGACLQWIKSCLYTFDIEGILETMNISYLRELFLSNDFAMNTEMKISFLNRFYSIHPELNSETRELMLLIQLKECEISRDIQNSSYKNVFLLIDRLFFYTKDDGLNVQHREINKTDDVVSKKMCNFDLMGLVWEISMMTKRTDNSSSWIAVSVSTSSYIRHRIDTVKVINVNITVHAIHRRSTLSTTHSGILIENYKRFDLIGSIDSTVIDDPFVIYEGRQPKTNIDHDLGIGDSSSDSKNEKLFHAFVLEIRIID